MAPHDNEFGTPRSALGFALAIALAAFSFRIAGVIADGRSDTAGTPVQSAVAPIVAGSCAAPDSKTGCARVAP